MITKRSSSGSPGVFFMEAGDVACPFFMVQHTYSRSGHPRKRRYRSIKTEDLYPLCIYLLISQAKEAVSHPMLVRRIRFQRQAGFERQFFRGNVVLAISHWIWLSLCLAVWCLLKENITRVCFCCIIIKPWCALICFLIHGIDCQGLTFVLTKHMINLGCSSVKRLNRFTRNVAHYKWNLVSLVLLNN